MESDMSTETEQPQVVEIRHGRRRSSGIIWGLILITLGGLFLLQQLTNFDFQNWWALFILIPAIGSFSSAWYAFQQNERFNEGVRSGISSGLIILTVAIIFLLGLDWTVWWPLMVIVPALTFIFSGFTIPGSRESERPLSRRLYRPWTGWIGLGALVLGAGFLARNLDIFDPATVLFHWWAIPILIAALGGVITSVMLVFSGSGFGWAGISNLVTTAIFAAVGLVALTGIDWNLLTPIIIIAAGVIILLGVFRK
jgi:hypothetical protein